jgi:cell fate (sporulation/competence/biofilm development) regulator YlbF (YheA/YmcA/DUF963 family)
MDEILDHARRLAELLAAHPRTRELREASTEVAGDAAAKSLEEDYSHLTAEVHHLEETGRPIEPETKRRLLDLQGRIRKSPALQRLFRAHAQFAEMMDGVQRTLGGALDEALAGPEAAEPPAPGAPPADGPGAAPEGGAGTPRKPDEPGTGRILWTP